MPVDKWEQYATPIAPAGPAAPQPTGDKWAQYATPVTPDAPADTRNGIQKSFDANTATSPKEPLLETGLKSVVNAVGTPFVHPLNTMKSIVGAVEGNGILRPMIDATKQDYRDGGMGYAATKLAGNLFGSAALAPVAEGAMRAPGAARGFLAGDVEAPITGTSTSPAARYQAAKRLGVNLDAADATNSPLLGNVKKIGENSLAGGHLYDASKAANTSALSGATDNFLDRLYEGDRESGGKAIQDALKQNQGGLQARSTAGFDSLPQDVPLPGLKEVGKRAQGMAAENARYQAMFPSLKPSRAMGVVEDVGKLGPQAKSASADSPFDPTAPVRNAVTPKMKPQSFSTGQKLRSDLLEFGRKNPDIVAGQGDAMVRELAGGVDDAITGGSAKLTPEQLETFRNSNADWKDMKETYDDPSNPFYHAVRTDNPSTLYGGIGSKTPENAQNLVRRLSPMNSVVESKPAPVLGGEGEPGAFAEGFARPQSPALGALRRGTVEGALKTTNDGSPNFRTFGTQLNRIPADYRAELFSPDQNATLQDIQHTSNVLGKDFNPSGSAKLGQKVAEAAALVPTLGAPLLQWLPAKAMTSPSFVDWLMRPSTRPNPLIAPSVAATSVLTSRNQRAQQ